MIVSIPGEMTAEMGRRVRSAVVAAAGGSGVNSAVISGLANEYIDYFTTPQEYDAQHYEGGATVYGRASGVALQEALVELTRSLVQGRPAPPPYPYDPRNGVTANAAPFPLGAASATRRRPAGPASLAARAPPSPGTAGCAASTARSTAPSSRSSAAPRPAPGETVDSDLGLAVLWTVDEDGLYRARWEPPLDQPLGAYRFRITANRYTLASNPFKLRPSEALTPRRVAAPPGKVAVVLGYPPARVQEDIGDPLPDGARASPTAHARRLRPGDLHRRRPAGHRQRRARRPLRGQREPRRPGQDPGRRRPRRLRQPHRPGLRLSGLSGARRS